VNSYEKVNAFTAPAVWNVLVVNKNLDTELAYKMTKIAFDHMKEINQVINVTKFTTLENMNRLKGVELHPGALKYLNENM
ncbi:MAG TPA: TAXI family TRAP transporter solute-binding subunit, partial [Psychromonas sp.]